MKQRIEWLDVMKGIAIILVILGHILNNMNLFLHPVNQWLHLFHMPFFFILSGFLATKTSSKGLVENIKNKFISLIIPFITGGFFFSLTMSSLNNYIFDLHHCGYWFLFSLFTCWIIFLPLSTITHPFHNIIKIAILLIPFFVGNLLMAHLPESISNSLSFPLSFAYYRFFILGYIIGIIYENQKLRKRIKIFFPSGSIFATTFIIFFFSTLSILTNPYSINIIPITIWQTILCVSLFSILYYSESFIPKKFFRILCTIGQNSLALYVFHFYFVYQFPITHSTNISPGFQTLIGLILTIITIIATMGLISPIKKNTILAFLYQFLVKN